MIAGHSTRRKKTEVTICLLGVRELMPIKNIARDSYPRPLNLPSILGMSLINARRMHDERLDMLEIASRRIDSHSVKVS